MLKEIQTRNRIPFREVVEKLKAKVFSVSSALLGNAVEADVAAQKVFVRLYNNAEDVARKYDFITYVYLLASWVNSRRLCAKSPRSPLEYVRSWLIRVIHNVKWFCD